jgi:flotillin
MFELTTQHLIVIGACIALAAVAMVVLTTLSKFYRRCGADEALVRTGSGGNKVVIGGGVIVMPVLHQLSRVSLRSVKLSVERAGRNALVTADKIKANVETELYVKVEPLAEDVLACARSFGERSLDENAIAELIEGKLTDALRSVSANQTFMSLHSQRKEFAEMIQAALSEELKKNGLTLENVSITSLSMVPVAELDASDVFDAEGLRAITESVATNREKTNQIQREKETQIQGQNVQAKLRSLELEQLQQQAEADQQRRVAEYAAIQSAETAKAVYTQEEARERAAYEKQAMVEKARITQEQQIAVAQADRVRAEREAQIASEKAQQTAEIEKQSVLQAAEIARQKALEAATIEKERVVGASLVVKEQAIETARIGKLVAITKSEEDVARASAAKALAKADEERAKQAIVTVEATAKAEREKAIAVIEAASHAEVEHALAAGETHKAREQAEAQIARARGDAGAMQAAADARANERRAAAQAEADTHLVIAEARVQAAEREARAIVMLADAEGMRSERQAQARQKLVEAENAVSDKLILRDVTLKALEVLPDVTRELMSPAQKISEIKVLQTNGLSFGGGSAGGVGALGGMSPILKTIMEAGAAYPLVRELMSFGGVDASKVEGDVKKLLGSLGTEVGNVLASDTKAAAPAAAVTTSEATSGTSIPEEGLLVVEDDVDDDDDGTTIPPKASNGHAAPVQNGAVR